MIAYKALVRSHIFPLTCFLARAGGEHPLPSARHPRIGGRRRRLAGLGGAGTAAANRRRGGGFGQRGGPPPVPPARPRQAGGRGPRDAAAPGWRLRWRWIWY
eukprot:1190248-Prorocentrum_minimum.AAC.5